MVEEFNRKVGKAMTKLETLSEVKLISVWTSSYGFGMIEPYPKDRYNLDLKLDSNLILKSQIIFDTRYPSFPPDIIVHKLTPELLLNTTNALLPGDDWDLDQEDCLYNWFQKIVKMIKKPAPKKRQWSLFEDDIMKGEISSTPKKEDKSHHLTSAEPPKKNIFSKRSRHETDESLFKTNMDDDFEVDPNQELLISQKTDTGNIPTYNRDRYKLKKKKELDLMEEGKLFEDQDELLSYKTKEEAPSRVANSSRTTLRNSFFTGNRSKSRSLDDRRIEEIDNEAVSTKRYRNDDTGSGGDDDDDTIMLVEPKKMRKSNQVRTLPPTTLERIRSQDHVKRNQEKQRAEQNKARTFNLEDNEVKRFEYRKKFMNEWLLKYESNIMDYDAKDFSRFTLMIDFSLPSKSHLYGLYKKLKQESVSRFKAENPGSCQIVKPKNIAPVIIHFKMQRSSFPASQLEIKLISVTNTTSPRSSEPDTMDLKYNVNTAKSMSRNITDIMQIITEAVPEFHYQI